MGGWAKVFLAGFALCTAGLAVIVLGQVLQIDALARAGAWLTVPLTALYAVALAMIVIAFPLSWAVNAASWARRAWLRCRRR